MATADIQVKVLTLDPVTAALIPVEGAQVTCRNSTFLLDGTLSTTPMSVKLVSQSGCV